MKQFRLLTLLALLMTAATGAWATDGIACSASDIGKVLCTDGSIYATVGDATTAQKTAAAMIAYIDATNNKGLAIALADESGTKDYEAAGTACSGKAAVTGGTWCLPSDKDWQYMFIGCGSSESYSPPTFAMSKSYSGLASKLTTAQGAALQSDFYWSSTKDEPNGAWGVVFGGSNATFYMEDKTVDHKVRACLAFDVTSTYTVSLKDGVKDADKWTITPTEATTTGILENTEVTLQYNGRLKVKGVKATSDAAPAANPNAYLKWDATKKELVEAEIPATATKVANADAGVTWAAGTYVVEGNVTIGGTITLSGNVNLIIKDGAKLTANQITSATNNLSIYGQAQMTGELVVNSTVDAIKNITTLEVHSAKVTAISSGNSCGGFYRIETFNVYGGLVDAEYTGGDGYGISLNLNESGSMNIYGGEVKAKGDGNGDTFSYGIRSGSGATVTVYGGTLWAENADNAALRNNITLKKGGDFSGKIETSDNGTSWTEHTSASTPTTKYVRVGY